MISHSSKITISISFGLIFISLLLGQYYFDNKSNKIIHTLPQESNGFMEDVVAKQFGENGLSIREVTSDKLIHYQKKNRSYFVNPIITIYKENEAPWIFKSKYGEALQGYKLLRLWDNVYINQAKSSNNEPISILTEKITYYTDSNKAKTTHPVTIKTVSGTVSSVGLDADFNKKRYILLSKARGKYENNS